MPLRWNSFNRAQRFGNPSITARLPGVLLGFASAILLVLLVLTLAAVTDLLVTRGRLEIPTDQLASVPDVARPPNSVDVAEHKAIFHNRGILPLVWRLRTTSFGPLAEDGYVRWPDLQSNNRALLALIVAAWCLALVYSATLYGLEWWSRASSAAAVRRIRHELFQQSVRLGAGDLLMGQKQNVVELFVDRTEAFARGLVAWSRAVPYAIVLVVLLVGLALWVDVWLALSAILLAALSRLMLESFRRRSQEGQALWGDLVRQQRDWLVEELRQIRLLANFTPAATPAGSAFEERLRQSHAAFRRQRTRGAADEPTVTLFLLAGAGLILLLAGLNVLQTPPKLSVAETVLLVAALGATYIPLRVVRQLNHALQEANPAAAEIMAYIDRRPSVGQVPEARPLARPSRELALVGVTLADARSQKLLNNVSLEIPCGGRTALIASDQETPVAVAGLFARLYDPAAGRILFDGQDIGLATLASLRANVALLLPDRLLVTGTVTENIACGDPRFSISQVTEAARSALAYDFIQHLPQGLDTIVGPHGQTLTLPEQMLLGLARVMLHNPAVVVLGETSEPFDPAIEEQLAAATEKAVAGRTLLVLARRIATLRAVERILLFHAGQLHGDGSHIDLLADSELYRHLNYVRFNEFRNQVSGEW